jgi:hypothetical protein
MFAIEVGMMIQELPKGTINNDYANQLIRSSPGTNYRAACSEKSMPDVFNKLKIVEQANERLAITVKSIKTARSKPRNSQLVLRTLAS